MTAHAMTRADDERLADLLRELRKLRAEHEATESITDFMSKLRSISRRYLPQRSVLRDGLDSEDLAQEGLVHLIQNVDQFRGQTMAEFLAFAKVVVRQQAVRQVRWQGVRRRELGATEDAEDHARDVRSPSADVVLEEDKSKLRMLLSTLSEAHQQPLRMRLDGMSNAEIADRLGLREDLVRKRLSRALKELQDKW